MTGLASLSGFPELLPAQRNAELSVVNSLVRTFELHGFANIETRAVEPMERLLSKGDIDKEVYLLRRLQAGEDAADAGVGLHYDLTVPLARYVLDNAGRLEFPFRRYQIQKAWRGERPQEGRYREFTQADIDIIGKNELPFHHDVEVAKVMAAALAELPLPGLRMQVNSRKLVEGFYHGLGSDASPVAVRRIVDRLDKLPRATIYEQLLATGLSEKQADLCLALTQIRTADTSFVDRVRDLGVKDDLLETGLEELTAIIESCRGLSTDRFTMMADLRIARGLDYYTGTVFEAVMEGFESLGSVCSGGRYDALAVDGATTYPGVGLCFGVSRALVPLFGRGLLTSTRSVPSVVLVALATEESRADSDAVADALRHRGIPTEVAATALRYGKQIRYAQRRGIPFVWFPGDESSADSVKDIRSGEQVDADATAWSPPVEDLHAQVVTKDSSE